MKVTVQLNEAHGGVEIRFSDKPSEAVLELLKENEWRFSRKDNDARWYKKRSPAAEKWAANLARILDDAPPVLHCDQSIANRFGLDRLPPSLVKVHPDGGARAAERVAIRIPATLPGGNFW